MLLEVHERAADTTACALPGNGASGGVGMAMRTVSTVSPMALSATHRALQATLASPEPQAPMPPMPSHLKIWGSGSHRDAGVDHEVDAARLEHVQHDGGLRQLQRARAGLHMHAAAQQRPLQARQHCLHMRANMLKLGRLHFRKLHMSRAPA